ncbi:MULTISPECIES: DMT family transporter [unclassified Meridianimarinicoccus]|uniref:DMT family transporter n=1 Tax=unclassified Meridianimarinicoccus TaxID=2923344 RepID=UPI001868CE05|nr:DMT family transporter [Fluviibacterium sp. MJW13]
MIPNVETSVTQQDNRLGILLMIATTLVFSIQDVLTRHLAENYSPLMVVMIRYWAFGLFVIVLATRAPGGLRGAARTSQPVLQILRGLLLAAEIVIMALAFVRLGLVETHAAFTAYPLIVAALSGPVLGEKVGWRRWSAIAAGFVGILIILQPGRGALQPAAVIPLVAAATFATYALLTRYASRKDSARTCFFWTGVSGAVAMTGIGLWVWEPMAPDDWIWMAALSLSGLLGHWLLIRSYAVAEASAVQPFAYMQLPFAAILGMVLFNEALRPNVATGAAIIVTAGVFTLWRERQTR